MTTTVSPPPGTLTGARQPHRILLAAGLCASALTIAALVLLQPWGERNALDYETLSADRALTWSTILLDGVAMAALGICLALIVTRLLPDRGAVLARVGGTLTAAGGVLFAMGIYAFGSLAWYATDPAVLSPADGAALLELAADSAGNGRIVHVGGFLAFTLGVLVLCAALLRAGTLGRAVPITVLVLSVAAFLAPSSVLSYLQAAQMVGLAALAVAAVRAEPR